MLVSAILITVAGKAGTSYLYTTTIKTQLLLSGTQLRSKALFYQFWYQKHCPIQKSARIFFINATLNEADEPSGRWVIVFTDESV